MDGEEQQVEFDKVKSHWIETSERDFELMLKLYDDNNYNWSLFIGHIVIERLLKALYVKQHLKHAPFTHNLLRLAELCELELTEEYAEWLDTTTSFNINTRYDDYKSAFYKSCTLEYTTLWINRIKNLRSWIKEKL